MSTCAWLENILQSSSVLRVSDIELWLINLNNAIYGLEIYDGLCFQEMEIIIYMGLQLPPHSYLKLKALIYK